MSNSLPISTTKLTKNAFSNFSTKKKILIHISFVLYPKESEKNTTHNSVISCTKLLKWCYLLKLASAIMSSPLQAPFKFIGITP